MNPILILRTEIVCLILLVYLAFVTRSFRMGKDGKIFNLIMAFAMVHLIMDGITVWTVNHRDTTLPFLNTAAHIVFYLSAMLFSTEILVYIVNLCKPEWTRKARAAADSLLAGYLILMLTGVLKIEYASFNGTDASVGSAPAAGFAICFLFFAVSIVLILGNSQRVGKHLRMLLVPMLFLLIAVEIIQILVKEFLFTGATITVITLGFFFSLENPAAVLEKKILLDALSGLGSRSSYEHDMQEYDAEFLRDKTIPFIFAFIDINNLRSVNGLYGHEEGDAYISRMAVILLNNMRDAEHIYRMGGDEFLAVYRRKEEKSVVRDIQRVNDACMRETERKNYHHEVAIGYAVSDLKYNSLRDVLRVADYMMYRNKTAMKREVAVGTIHEAGTRLNLYGLTDRVFDAMCLTSEEFYPYINNLETGVTRVAPAMAEFFGLESEFIQDFLSVWLEHVHPADRDGYEQDVRATLKGLKEYHFYRYRAKGKDGNYVDVTCRGGMYHGRDGEPDIFSGYIVNHGAPKILDSDTGLMNQEAFFTRIMKALETNEKILVIRLESKNLSRARMLYGPETIFSAMRSVADLCLRTVKDRGEVYSEGGKSFILVLPECSRNEATEYFNRIRETCANGLIVNDKIVPLDLCAGAAELPSEQIGDAQTLRSAVLFAVEEAGYSQEKTIRFYQQDTADIGENDIILLRTIHHDCLTDREHFFLRLQPIMDAQTGTVTGAEALLRYRSDNTGEVPPGRFISFLESDPAYTELGFDIIRHAVRHAARIREKLPEFSINVNITAMQLYADDFVPRVGSILEEEHYPADHLILELTERCKEMEFDFLRRKVTELRQVGIRIALDDMGTGFSTIDLLLHLDANEIKLDMEFTSHMRENKTDPEFARLLV